MPNPTPADLMINYLVDQRFGVNGPGVDLSAARRARKDSTLAGAIAKFEKELRALSTEKLKELYELRAEEKANQIKVHAEIAEGNRFFNKPHAQSDFDHWSKAAYWSLDEAVALSLGKEPEHVNWKIVESYVRISPFARNYSRRRDLTQRAVGMKQLTDGVVPGFFLGWAKRNELSVPEELVQLVEKRGQSIADWPTLLKDCQEEHAKTIARAKEQQDETLKWAREQQDKTLKWAKDQNAKALEAGKSMVDQVLADMGVLVSQRDEIIAELNQKIAEMQGARASTPVASDEALKPKSRQSLLKLVLGMALDGYGYDPKDKRSPIPKELADALSGKGISIDEDTVRKWLKEAFDEVAFSSPDQPDDA
jgi:hypothetical protein